VTAFAHLATKIGDRLAAPFGDHAGWALLAASLVFAVVALVAFKFATPQRRLAAARSRLIGRLYEAALYQANLPVILRVQGGVLAANLRYLVLALPAVVALAVPLFVVLPQLEARLGRRPLAVGEAALVTATLPAGAAADLAGAPGLTVEAGPVRDAARDELVWRVRATAPGEPRLRLVGPDFAAELTVPVAVGGLPALTAARHRGSLAQAAWDPAGAVLPANVPLRRFAVALPARQVRVLGLAQPWLVGVTVLSLAAGLALRRPLRVEL